MQIYENTKKQNTDEDSSISRSMLLDEVDEESQTTIPPLNKYNYNITEIKKNLDKDGESGENIFVKRCGCFCISITVVLTILFVFAYIAWLIFSIKALTNTSNREIKDKCEKSDIWALMLTLIIVSGIYILSAIINNDKNNEITNKNSTIFINSCLQIALTVWTGIEINSNCAKNNLNDKTIYMLLTQWFYYGCVSIGLMFVCGSCLICKKI